MKKKSSAAEALYNYRQFLMDELQKRQKRNPAYSLRAFSRDLGINSSRLSEILNSKAGLSEDRAVTIAEKLQLTEKEKALFVDLVQSEHARSNIAKAAAQKRLRDRLLNSRNIPENEFSIISEWFHLALIALLNLEKVEHSVASFAKALGLPAEAVQNALAQLIELGYIEKQGDKWIPKTPDTTTDTDIPSKAIRTYHKQMLDKAKGALDTIPVEKRDFSSVVMAINSNQLSYAKERIEAFRRTLMKDLEEIPGKDTVYCLSIQLFELTEKT